MAQAREPGYHFLSLALFSARIMTVLELDRIVRGGELQLRAEGTIILRGVKMVGHP